MPYSTPNDLSISSETGRVTKIGLCSVLYIIFLYHIENTPIRYNSTFYGCKNEKFQMKKKCELLLFLLDAEIVGTR